MKKIIILLLSMIILFSSGIYSKENIINIGIQMDINNAFRENIKWSPDSDKIGVILNKVLFIIDKNGKIVHEIKRDFKYNNSKLEWIDTNIVAFTYGDKLELLNLKTDESKIFTIGYAPFSISYNDKRKEFAISSDYKIRLLNIETGRFEHLIEFNEIFSVFYNRDGTRIFFTAFPYHMNNRPYLYTYSFETWAFDRITGEEEFFSLYFIDQKNNIGYFMAGIGREYGGPPLRVVEMNLETLKIKEYEEPDNKLRIDGYEVDPNIRKKYYWSDNKSSIIVFLSPDLESAFVVDDEGARMIRNLSSN